MERDHNQKSPYQDWQTPKISSDIQLARKGTMHKITQPSYK